jgi:hypothetical protein
MILVLHDRESLDSAQATCAACSGIGQHTLSVTLRKEPERVAVSGAHNSEVAMIERRDLDG